MSDPIRVHKQSEKVPPDLCAYKSSENGPGQKGPNLTILDRTSQGICHAPVPAFSSPLYHATRCDMSVPTFEEMRARLMPVWEKKENSSMITWAGIFGSVGRGRARQHSDVDVVLVMKEGVTGEPVELEQGELKSFQLD